MQASDELSLVVDKYTQIIINGRTPPKRNPKPPESSNVSLLDFASPEAESKGLLQSIPSPANGADRKNSQTDIDVLCDIFATNETVADLPASDILMPMTVTKKEQLSGLF